MLISCRQAVSLWVAKPLKSMMANYWPMQGQIYAYFPSCRAPSTLDWYQIILLVTEAYVATTCQKSLPKIRKAGTGTHDLLSRKSNALTITPTGHTNTVFTKKYLFLPADNYIIKTRCCHTYRLDSILKVFYGLFHMSSVSQLCLCSNLHVQRQVYVHCSATYVR